MFLIYSVWLNEIVKGKRFCSILVKLEYTYSDVTFKRSLRYNFPDFIQPSLTGWHQSCFKEMPVYPHFKGPETSWYYGVLVLSEPVVPITGWISKSSHIISDLWNHRPYRWSVFIKQTNRIPIPWCWPCVWEADLPEHWEDRLTSSEQETVGWGAT